MAARNGPRIGSQLDLVPCPDGKQGGDFFRIAFPHHVALDQIVAPRRGQVAGHLQSHKDRIHSAPGPRLKTKQRKLDRQRVAMGRDKFVHPARVRRQGRAILGRQFQVGRLSDAAHSQPARLAVVFQTSGADDFGQFPRRQPPQAFHLKQTVLRGHVPLNKQRIVQCGGANMGLAQPVERYRDRSRNAHRHGSRTLR